MATFNGTVQHLNCEDGHAVFWLGPSGTTPLTFQLSLQGTVANAASSAAAVCLLMNAHVAGHEVQVHTDATGLVTLIRSGALQVAIDPMLDSEPYAPRVHGHAGMYQPVGNYAPADHGHVEYALTAHGHVEYALAAHNHDHDALIDRVAAEHRLAIAGSMLAEVPPAVPRRLVSIADELFDGVRAELQSPRRGGPIAADDEFVARFAAAAGEVLLSAVVVEREDRTAPIIKVLTASIRQLVGAPLRWQTRLEDPRTGAEYTTTNLFPSNGYRVLLSATTFLNAP